jgi:CRISPR-associated protein Cmr4
MSGTAHIPAGFSEARVIALWCETPLHPGVGMSVKEGVDLPIHRERLTELPLMPASGLKGTLRKAAERALGNNDVKALFGPDPEHASEHAGSLLLTDAHTLLFPIPTLGGFLCWATSPLALARLAQNMRYLGLGIRFPTTVEDEKALVATNTTITVRVGGAEQLILLGEFQLIAQRSGEVDQIAREIVDKMLPEREPSYEYIRATLPGRLAIVSDRRFRELTKRGVEVQTRVRLGDGKTVEEGGLWSEEHLPALTLLQLAAFLPEKFRGGNAKGTPAQLFDRLFEKVGRVVVGGDETVGRGLVRLVKL